MRESTEMEQFEEQLRVLEGAIQRPGGFEAWANEYAERGEALLDKIDQLLVELGSRRPYHPYTDHTELIFRLRRMRGGWHPRFCLLLHSSTLNRDFLAQLDDSDPEQLAQALPSPEQTWRMASMASVLLDDADVLTVTMVGGHTPPQKGVLQYRFDDDPKNLWFPKFTCLAELADAIVLMGGFGAAVNHELRWLDLTGLKPRMLTLSKAGRILRPRDRQAWPFAEFATAVADTAGQPIGFS